jgi:alkylation response protein AidB-like acyl-CoA dehydrogenase
MTTYLDLNKELTFDETSIKEQVHRFGVEVLRPAAAELDPLPPEQVISKGSPLWDVFGKAYQLGYHTSGLPEALGGAKLPWRGTSTPRSWAGQAPISHALGGAIPFLRSDGRKQH